MTLLVLVACGLVISTTFGAVVGYLAGRYDRWLAERHPEDALARHDRRAVRS